MKKILVLSAIMILTANLSFAGSVTNDLKNAVKADINNSVNAATTAHNNTAAAKKAEKIAQINAKLVDLNKQLEAVKADKNITETERTLKIKTLQSQIDFYNKQKTALK